MLSGLFERCMKRRGIRDSDPYDWEKVQTADASTVSNNPQTASNTNAQTGRRPLDRYTTVTTFMRTILIATKAS